MSVDLLFYRVRNSGADEWSRRVTMIGPDLLRNRILVPVDSSRKAVQQAAMSQIRQPDPGGVEADVRPHLCAGAHTASNQSKTLRGET
jgi:hypothetical protein